MLLSHISKVYSMLRRILTSSLIVSQLLASAAYAKTDPVYYYRYTKDVVDSPNGPTEPEEPDTTKTFIARNIGGDSDVVVLGADGPSVSISLFDPVSGAPFYNARSWQLVSGSLPQGIVADLSEDKQTMRFKGVAIAAGVFDNIVYEVKDYAGHTVSTKPLTLRVVESGIALYLLPDETPTIRAQTEQVELRVVADNVRTGYPVTYEVNGALPAGITYSVVDGELVFSGTADIAGQYNGSVTARDDLGRSKTIPIAFNVTTHFKAVNSRNGQYLDGNTGASVVTTLREVDTGEAYTGGATWTLSSGALPNGVIATPSSDGSQMVYSGLATKTGTFEVTWLVDDGQGNFIKTNPVKFYVGVAPQLQVFSSRGSSITLDTATDRKTIFTADGTADGNGIPDGNWKITGELPVGMALVQSSEGAVLSGVPQKTGQYKLTVTATDALGRSDDFLLYLVVVKGFDLLQTKTYEDIYVNLQSFGSSYRLRTVNTGTTGRPYADAATKWELVSGKLPAGVHAVVSDDRSSLQYSGSPTETGTFDNIVWRVTDRFGNTSDSRPLTLTVTAKEALHLAREGWDADVQTVSGLPYDPSYIRVRATNFAPDGILPDQWVVDGLPDGMRAVKSPVTVTFVGAPKKTGQYVVKVSATDDFGDRASIDVPINVVNGLSAAQYNAVSESIKEGGAKPQTGLVALLTAANAPYTDGDLVWTLVGGTLPPGITLAPVSGGSVMRFEGSATKAGTYSDIVFRVADVNGNTFDTKPFTFTVEANNEVLSINNAAAQVEAFVGGSLDTSLQAVGTAADEVISPGNWTISGLPDGVVPTWSSDGKTLTLRGTYTKSGTFTANISVKDRLNRTATSSVSFQIGAAYKLLGSDSVGQGSGEQVLYNYITTADRQLRIQNVETGEFYTDGATWDIETDNLPAGVVATLSPDGSTMRTSGYPMAVTNGWKYTYWNVTLANGAKARGTLGFNAFDSALSLGSDQTTSTFKDVAFSRSFTVANFGTGGTFTIDNVSSSTLPAGVSLRVSGNRLFVEGTPTQVATTPITLTVTDHFGRAGSAKLNLTVNPPFVANRNTPITGTAVTGDVNKGMLWATKATGGLVEDVDLVWTLETGSLPPGMRLEGNGYERNSLVLRGYGTTAGTWKSTWRATDPDGNYVISPEITVTLSARANLTLGGSATASIISGTAVTLGTFTPANTAFGQQIAAEDWTVTGLPPGMSTSVVNGVMTISGTPTTYGTYSLSVQAKDAAGQNATYTRSVVVNPPIEAKINTPITGTAFTADFNKGMLWLVKTGTSTLVSDVDVVWTLESGSLPQGLRLEKNATERNSMTLRGYAEQTGTFKSTWRATAPDGSFSISPEVTVTVGARTAFTLSGGNSISIAPSQVGNLGTFIPAGAAFGQGVAADKWTVANLPPGLTPTVVNGNLTISGTATTAGTYNVVVTAVDASGATATRSVTATIKAPFRIVNNYGTITLIKDVNSSRTALLFWDDNNAYITTVKTLTVLSGSLPPGMSTVLGTGSNAGTAILSGAPTVAGTYQVRYQVLSSTNVPVQSTSDVVIIVN
jgi:hypothetical protein